MKIGNELEKKRGRPRKVRENEDAVRWQIMLAHRILYATGRRCGVLDGVEVKKSPPR